MSTLFKHQKFAQGDAVIVHSLGDERTFEGIIRGKSIADHYFPEHYIVEIVGGASQMRKDYNYSCISITEACLKPKPKSESELNGMDEFYDWVNR